VVTAVPLDEQGRQELAGRLSQITGKQVLIEAHEDPQILGGLVARIGDRLIDGSTRSKLSALRRELVGSGR
jgi:F-type H+-transporting ATPase subunit delta